MSLSKLKTLFENLKTCDTWSIQLLKIKTSNKNGTSYVGREITLNPQGKLCEFVKEISDKYEYTIVDAKESKSIITDYMLSYILPLFVFDFTHLDGVVMFLIFFITLGFLCIKHNNFCVNIIFEIANYRFYRCTLKNEDNVEINRTIISRSRLKSNVGNVIHLKLLNNEFCMDIK